MVDNSELRSVDTLIPFFDQSDLIPVFVGQFTAQDTPQLEVTDATGTNRSAATNADRLPVLFDGVVDGVIDDNGDGFTDIVSEGIVFLNNNGDGNFTNTGRAFTGTFEEPVLEVDLVKAPPITGFDLIAFDADEDGDLDLGYESESGFVTLTNQGGGSFVRAEGAPLATAPQDASLQEPVATNDFNSDGLEDQLVFTPRNRNGETGLTVALALGDGSFSAAVSLSNEMTDFPPQVLDYDSDGDLDILFVHQDFFFTGSRETIIPPSFLQIFLNDGAGAFSLNQEIQLSEELSESVGFQSPAANTLTDVRYFDFDDDGVLDVLSRFRYGLRVLTAQGATFATSSIFGPEEEFFSLNDLIVADFDGDQLLDLGVLDSQVGTVSLIRNTTGNPPVLSVEAEPIAEDARTYLVTFSLDQPSDTFVSANFILESGTATLGEDFLQANTNFIGFAAGETRVERFFTVINDSIVEGEESFSLRLSNPVGLTFAEDTLPLTIFEPADQAPELILTVTNPPAIESDEELPIVFTLNVPSPERMTVDVSVESGTAVEGSDFRRQKRHHYFFCRSHRFS